MGLAFGLGKGNLNPHEATMTVATHSTQPPPRAAEMKGESMARSAEPRKLSPVETALTAVLGVGGGLFIALYSFVQLRAAWLNGTVAFGRVSNVDFDYESEPLSYIVAMSALFPAAIVCGVALAIVSVAVLMRQREAARRQARRKAR